MSIVKLRATIEYTVDMDNEVVEGVFKGCTTPEDVAEQERRYIFEGLSNLWDAVSESTIMVEVIPE